jgi:hypothetical protein
MINKNGLRIVTIILGVLSLAAMVLSHLALVDISHGEENVSLEWAIVQISAGILFVYICLSLLSMWKIQRTR